MQLALVVAVTKHETRFPHSGSCYYPHPQIGHAVVVTADGAEAKATGLSEKRKLADRQMPLKACASSKS